MHAMIRDAADIKDTPGPHCVCVCVCVHGPLSGRHNTESPLTILE